MPDPYSEQQYGILVYNSLIAQVKAINNINILNLHSLISCNQITQLRQDSCGLPQPLTDQLSGMLDSPGKTEGRTPLCRGKIYVPRTHCQPVSFPDDRVGNNLDIPIKILKHAPDHGKLLKIFAAEHRDVRPDNMKQFRHNSGYAAEVTGSVPAA